MKPFKLTPAQKAVNQRKFNRQEKIVQESVAEIQSILFRAADQLIDNVLEKGVDKFVAPSLRGLHQVMERFYRRAIREGWAMSEEELGHPIKRMSIPKGNVPKKIRGVEDLFNDNKYWKRITKRSTTIADRMQAAYLKKLRVRFNDVVPRLLAGEATPTQVKIEIREGWEVSKARTETIFRTETTKYFAQTQISFFSGNENIIGFLFDSVRDAARTSICRSRHGLVYRPNTQLLRINTPACHYNCRSHLIPLANIPSNRKMLEDPSRDPEKVSVVPLPPGWSS